jgi:hypothetical protein
MYVLNAAELIGVPLHHRFALPAQGRSSIILCGAIIEALMAAACEAVAERTIVQSDGYPIALRYEWRVRTEANFA